MHQQQHHPKRHRTNQEVEDEKIKRAKALYATRPFVTKTFMAIHYKYSMEFLNKHWNKITSN